MTRFLLCSFALVLLYPSGIDMYLVGLPRIAQDLGASEAQLHIAFSVYLAGMASAMLFAGRIADHSGRKPVAIVGAAIFVIASLLCAQAHTSSHFLIGRFIQGIGAGSCYVVAFAILRDTLDDRRRAKVLSLLNGITCIIPVLAPVLGHLIMLKYPWQSLFYTMTGMGVMVAVLSVFILRETRPTAPPQAASPQHDAGESLLNRFFLSRLLITTLSVTVILTYVNVSPVLMMEEMGFDRGTYSMAMALMAMISMAVSFSTPFALSLFNPLNADLTGAVSGGRRDAEPRHSPGRHPDRAGHDLRRLLRWVRRRDEPGAGAVHAARGRRQLGPRHRAGVRFIAVDLARRHHRTQRNEYADRDTHCL